MHYCKLVSQCPVPFATTVVSALASVIRAAGLSPIVEPRRMPSSDDKKLKRLRPDIMVYGTRKHCWSTGHKDDDARREQRIIQRREQQKRDKYRLLAKLHDNGRVVPFVVDAYGAFGVGRSNSYAHSAPSRRATGVLNVSWTSAHGDWADWSRCTTRNQRTHYCWYDAHPRNERFAY